jgi:hypothetical protein
VCAGLARCRAHGCRRAAPASRACRAPSRTSVACASVLSQSRASAQVAAQRKRDQRCAGRSPAGSANPQAKLERERLPLVENQPGLAISTASTGPASSSPAAPARSAASPSSREQLRLRGLPVAATVLGACVPRAVVVVVAEVPLHAGENRPRASRTDDPAGGDSTLPDLPQLLVTVAVPSLISGCHSWHHFKRGYFVTARGCRRLLPKKSVSVVAGFRPRLHSACSGIAGAVV